jgi:phthalate 4,5-cis-dihydrodiol dehydrogenase
MNHKDHLPVLRMGIIGLGMAGLKMIETMQKHANIQLTAAADLHDGHLEAFARDYQAEIYKDAAQLCQSPNVDAVYIATPNAYHCEHAIMAASYGKHVIVEKPIAMTLEEADRMIEAADRYGVKLCVCHKRSLDPPIQKMREIVESGILGSVRMIHNWHYNDWLYRPRSMEELEGGGVVLRQGSHQFDMIRYIAGSTAETVRADVGVWDPARIADGAYTAFIQFSDGTTATSVYNGYGRFMSSELTYGIDADGKQIELEQFYEKRRLLAEKRKSGEESAYKIASGYTGNSGGADTSKKKAIPHFGLTVVSCEHGDIKQSSQGLYVYDDDGVNEIILDSEWTGLDELIHQFYQSIFTGRTLIHDGRWGKANLEMCLAVLESSKHKKEVRLTHQG